MGKINQGILGGFNGKVGSVIGASWKGISYMRGIAQSIKDPKTEARMEIVNLSTQVARLTLENAELKQLIENITS